LGEFCTCVIDFLGRLLGDLLFAGRIFDEEVLFVGCMIGSVVFFTIGSFLDLKFASKKQPLSRS
jgi:hypothetical protein